MNPYRRSFPVCPSTKMPILCSKRPKMGVPKGKSAHKPQFCARNARKQGFQRAKAHKNLDFVLEKPKNGCSGGQKSTKTHFLCSKGSKMRARSPKKHKKAVFVLGKRGNWHREAQPLPSCKSPRTLPKYKDLITRQLTFSNALGELKLRPPRGPMCPRGA